MGEEMTKTVDQWAAAQCGVIFSDGAVSKNFFWECGDHIGGGWSIEKLECKEAFRDWWLNDKPSRLVMFYPDKVIYLNGDEGFIYKDEGSCITAIYEASQ